MTAEKVRPIETPQPAPPGPATQGEQALHHAQYLPIADYGVIGDGRGIALVSKTGSIDWWCLPHPDGDPIFARLLDSHLGGYFVVQPRGPYQSRQYYVDETAILVTEFQTDEGVVRISDFMPALTEDQKKRFPVPFRMIVRRVQGVSGRVPLRVQLKARPEYASRTPHARQQRVGLYALQWGDQAVHLTSSVPLRVDPGLLSAELDAVAEQQVELLLTYSPEAPAELPVLGSVDLLERLTEQFWRNWCQACTYTGPYAAAVYRSALTLKLLSYAPTGAIVAAATTSLPEDVGGVRNWDYRYCWVRDAAFTIRALLALGHSREAHAFAMWLLYTTRLTHPNLQVLYTIYGESHIPEKTLDYLDGYEHSRPVRVGNAASNQFQLDVYGEVLDALRIYRRAGGGFDRDARGLIAGMAGVIADRWCEPDDGIWEVRSGRAQHIHSKVMAWTGLQAVIEIAKQDPLGVSIEHLQQVSDEIKAWVLEHGFDKEIGSFTRTPGHDLDAALLVIPLVGFLEGNDPRVISTVDTIRKHLADGPLVYRYKGQDGLPGQEGAFLICSFWLVEALTHIGRLDEAHQLFMDLLGHCNGLGLLSEEIDPSSGALLGNFPQAFSHIGLINAALTLQEAETGETGGPTS